MAEKSGLEELAAEPGDHVSDGGFGLGAVPRAQEAAPGDVGGVVAGAGVPADQQRLDEEPERDGPFNGGGDPVAGVPDSDDLLARRVSSMTAAVVAAVSRVKIARS